MTRLNSRLATFILGIVLAHSATAQEVQLDGTRLYGTDAAQQAALLAADGILRIVNGFEVADSTGEMTPITTLANSVYAENAVVFRSQGFITEEDVGGPAFLKALGFINDELGSGTEYLAPQQVCAIYAFHPDSRSEAIDFVMATEAIVPQFGQVLNTVLVRTQMNSGVRRITYHDYISEPAGGEDCTGPAVAAFDEEWSAKME